MYKLGYGHKLLFIYILTFLDINNTSRSIYEPIYVVLIFIQVADTHLYSVAILPERDAVVDFLYPIAYTYDVFFLRVNTTKNSFMAKPFSLPVWAIVGASILTIGLTLTFVEQFQKLFDDNVNGENREIDSRSYALIITRHILTVISIQFMNGEFWRVNEFKFYI